MTCEALSPIYISVAIVVSAFYVRLPDERFVNKNICDFRLYQLDINISALLYTYIGRCTCAARAFWFTDGDNL